MFKNNTSDLNIKYLKLEITNCLMEIEYRKMDYLKSQLHSTKLPDLLKIRLSNEIFFIERKIQKLQHEYQHIGLEFIEVNRINYLNKQNCKNQIQFISANMKKNNRSQPAIGIKQTSKARPTIFPIIESYLRCRSPGSDNSSDTDNSRSSGHSEDCPECCTRLSSSSSSSTTSSSSSAGEPEGVSLLSSSVDSGTSSIDVGGQRRDDEGGGHLYQNIHISPPKEFTFKDTTMTSCDLETLLKHLLPTAHHSPDHSYTFTFLLCSRLFLRPDQLFEQIFFAHFLNATTTTTATGNAAAAAGQQKKFYKNFIENLLYEWTTVFPYDFAEARLMALFGEFAQKAHATLEKNFAKNLRKYVDRKLNLSLLYDNYLKSLLPEAEAERSGGGTGGGDAVPGDQQRRNNEQTAMEESQQQQQRQRRPRTLLEECIFYRKSSSSSTSPHNDDSKGERLLFLLDIFSKERSPESAKRTLTDLRRLANESDIMDLCSEARVVAQQLTLIEFERLSFIGPQEFVQTFIKEQLKHQKTVFAETAAGEREEQRKRREAAAAAATRNVDNYVAWFNRLSNLVAAEIVGQVKPKGRVKMAEFWIEVAGECLAMGNLNSLMAVIAGLNLAPISRLKKMWSKVTTLSKFQWLEQQMDPSNNFSNYRSILKSSLGKSPASAGGTTGGAGAAAAGSCAGDRKACDPVQLVEKRGGGEQPLGSGSRKGQEEEDSKRQLMIPFFSLLVKDLYFLNEGCANRLPNGHINFEKCWQFSKQISEFLVWKEYQCTYEKVHAVIFYLETRRTCRDDNELALKSFACEPPENLVEKGRLRLLKKSP